MLKRLEIQGFKSFAEKVHIDFKPGLTVIVGPNGSGKSNITDAINWALGEHRASALRGTRMEEVIFAGSDRLKAVGMGEVSVTLDNKKGIFALDYSEVTITRRIFRSGESQFFINKVPCRLKDIHSLLMDTGIGKGAYAIIGQGKVEEILHSKAEERRTIIEEAAGIVKYRHRKEEALAKLAKTQQDLVRLSDIISELSDRLAPLKEEAEKAKLWRRYVGERRRLELGLLAGELEAVEIKLSQIEQQLRQAGDNNAVGGQTQQDILQLEQQIKAKKEQYEQYRNEYAGIRSEIQRTESFLDFLKERMTGGRQDYQRLLQKKAIAEERLYRLAQEDKEEHQRLQQLTVSVQPSERQLMDISSQLKRLTDGVREKEVAIEKGKAKLIELMNASAQGKAQLQRAEERKIAAERRLSHLRRVIGEAREEQLQTKDELNNFQREIAELNDKIKSNEQKLSAQEKERQVIKELLHSEQEKIRHCKEELSRWQSKLHMLVESQRSYLGYQRGVRELLLALKAGKVQLHGICGTVAELIQVPHHLELAVETVLGGALQQLVTNTDVDARKVIEYLKANKLGRVTFLPLNTLRPQKRHPLEKQALAMPGVMGVAADLIEYQPQYGIVAEFLLGKVLVVENIDFALKVAKASDQRLRLVTLEGEYLHPGGSLTGGSPPAQNRGLLKNRREKRECELRVQQLQRQLTEYAAEEDKLTNTLKQLEESIDLLRDRVMTQKISLAGKTQQLVQLRERLNRTKAQSQDSDYEINNLEMEIANQDEAQQRAAHLVAVSEGELTKVQAEILTHQEQLKDIKEKIQSLEKQFTSTKVTLAEVKQEQEGIKKLLSRLDAEKEQCRNEINSLNKESEQIKRKSEQLEQDLEQKNKQLRQHKEQEGHLSTILSKTENEIQQLTEQLEALRRQLQVEEEQLRKQQQMVHNLQLQQARLETERRGLLDRLEQDYNIHQPEQLKPTDNMRRCKARILELRNLIEEMGQVNPVAEDEYKQLQGRHNYLLHQQQDIEQSKQSLQQLIEEMDTLMAQKFTGAFKKIEREFGLVFKELFGGGYASIRMVGDDPLTAGIEIVAQPPGKKMQNIGLLSGGERSLTAIALLFAILKISPSPFCILDEIEAALDEANVDRFADYLLKLSETIQFVVVSHRKGTMERAEILYGVTMDNRGTSKIFSIEMSRAESAASQLEEAT
ncbi:chromosome segregation protein SMC [Desulfofalx alkaliphila]|uniref:chromosome segregation protein SMC n=1 Tax=Desulfofalx alkaliphila TaxID=105483 RepID=UPI0005578E25|nr:chromosome segregation protein SMC [Desulfofalx alkaliphila]